MFGKQWSLVCLLVPLKYAALYIDIGAETGVVRGGFTPPGFCQVGFFPPWSRTFYQGGYTLPDQGDPWLGRVLLPLCHFDIANPSISDDIIKLTCN